MNSRPAVTLCYAMPVNGWTGRRLAMLLVAVVFLVSAVLTLFVLQFRPRAGLQTNPGMNRQNAPIIREQIALEPVLRDDEMRTMRGIPEEEERLLANPALR